MCVNVVAADSQRDARFLFTSMQQQFVNLRRGTPGQLPPPVEDMEKICSPAEQFGVDQALRLSIIGDRSQVKHGLESLLRETQADELMVNGQIFDHQARLYSFEIVASLQQDLQPGEPL